MHVMKRYASIGVGLGLVLAACGGGGPDVPPTQDATNPPDASSPSTAAPATEPPAAPATDPPAPNIGQLNTAVVTIGDERYEFSDVQCSIFTARYIQAGNYGGEPEVVIVLPPDGWESQGDTFSPPAVRVRIGGGQYWVAGDDDGEAITPIPEGSSLIDSYSVPDGRPVTATGTATFFDVIAHNNGEDAPSVMGSFEVTCP